MKRCDVCHGRVLNYEWCYVLFGFDFLDGHSLEVLELHSVCRIMSIQYTTSNYVAFLAKLTVMFQVMVQVIVFMHVAGPHSLRGNWSSCIDICRHLMSLRDQFCIIHPQWQLFPRPWRAITEQFAPMLLSAPSICHTYQRMLPWDSQLHKKKKKW